MFLMLSMASYGCSRCRCRDSRVPYVYHGLLWLFTVSFLVVLGKVVFLMLTMASYGCSRCRCWDSRVPYVYHGLLWLFTVSFLG